MIIGVLIIVVIVVAFLCEKLVHPFGRYTYCFFLFTTCPTKLIYDLKYGFNDQKKIGAAETLFELYFDKGKGEVLPERLCLFLLLCLKDVKYRDIHRKVLKALEDTWTNSFSKERNKKIIDICGKQILDFYYDNNLKMTKAAHS